MQEKTLLQSHCCHHLTVLDLENCYRRWNPSDCPEFSLLFCFSGHQRDSLLYYALIGHPLGSSFQILPRDPQGNCGLSCAVVMTYIRSKKSFLGLSNIQGPNLGTAPARLDSQNPQKTACKNLRWANKAKNRSWVAEEIRENVVSDCAACSLGQLVELT